MTKRKSTLSTVVAFMSEEAQDQVREGAGIVSTLPLAAILPDPEQPRQLLPEATIKKIVAGLETPAAALQAWIKQAQDEAAAPALKKNVRELQHLADSIARHGLINPISVRRIPAQMKVPEGVKHLIITGERRYWAHILLQLEEREIQEGVETSSPERIKATIAPEGISIRAHQIIENLLREDIDAVEKATGFTALRQELSGLDPTIPDGEVNHGSPPKLVTWDQVEETLGISRRYRQYVTAVLNLTPEAQAIIRANGLTERAIRPISQKLKQHPVLQVKALEQIVREGVDQSAFTVDEVVDSILPPEERRPPRQVTFVADQPISPEFLHTRVKSALRLFERLGETGDVEAWSKPWPTAKPASQSWSIYKRWSCGCRNCSMPWRSRKGISGKIHSVVITAAEACRRDKRC